MSDFPDLPPIATEPLSVVLLAPPEEDRLAEMLPAWIALLAQLDKPHEILLVLDGPREPAPPLAEASPFLRVLHTEGRHGSGAALRTGLAAARHPLVLTAPCDHQFQPDDLRRLLQEIDRVHLVTGYRVWQPLPPVLRWLGWIYRLGVRVALAHWPDPLPGWLGWRGYAHHLAVRALFGLRVRDVDCLFRLYRRTIWEHLPIQSDGTFALAEILAKANFLGCVMTETPVSYQPPPQDPATDRERERLWWTELRAVFFHPDFRPSLPRTTTSTP